MLLITNMRKRDSAKMECLKKNKGGVYNSEKNELKGIQHKMLTCMWPKNGRKYQDISIPKSFYRPCSVYLILFTSKQI